MIEVFFDTETTGVVAKTPVYIGGKKIMKFAPIGTQTAEIIQLAYIIYKDGVEQERASLFFKPLMGIPKQTTDIHGITEEMVENAPRFTTFLPQFKEILKKANKVIGHNVSFDIDMFFLEIIRNEGISEEMRELRTKLVRKQVCTMEKSTDFCQIPGGYRGYKWPRLAELYWKLFGESMKNAHDAMFDVEATKKCYREMQRLNLIK